MDAESLSKWLYEPLAQYLKHYKIEKYGLLLAGLVCAIQAGEIWFFANPERKPWAVLIPQPKFDAWIQYPILNISAIALVITVGLLSFKMIEFLLLDKRKRSVQKTIGAILIFAGSVSLGIIVFYGLRWFEVKITSTSIEKILESSDSAIKINQPNQAIRLLFNAHEALAIDDSRQYDILNHLSSASLKAKQYQKSIRFGCEAIIFSKSGNNHQTLPPSNHEESTYFAPIFNGSVSQQSISQSLYEIAHTMPFTESVNLISNYKKRYSNACDEALSIYWIAMSPEVVGLISSDPYRRTSAWSTFTNKDRQTLLTLVRTYQSEPTRDIALYILENYFEIIVSHPQSKIMELARYAYGLQFSNKGDYDNAIEQFERYVSAYPNDSAHSDALWRIAYCYTRKGDYQAALTYLLQALATPVDVDPDGIMVSCPECDLMYTIERVSEDHLSRLKSLKPGFEPIFTYIEAYHSLARANYAESRNLFEQFVERSDDFIEEIPEFPIQTMKKNASKKVKEINMLLELLKASTPEIRIQNEVAFLIENPFFLMNEFWAEADVSRISIDTISGQWYLEHSTRYRAAKLLEGLLLSKNMPRDIELQIREQIAGYYRQAASDKILQDTIVIEMLRQSSMLNYKYVLKQLPVDSPQFDEMFEVIGGLYLERINFNGKWLERLTLNDVRNMRREYLSLAQEYSTSHLANNALNWAAWSHCFEANYHLNDLPKYIDNYSEALKYYEMIRDNYPPGLTRNNAVDNIEIIKDKLKTTERRVHPDESVWTWY